MTRDEMAAGLTLLVVQLANDAHVPEGWTPAGWAYLRGIASGEIMRLRDRLVAAGAIGARQTE